MTKTIDQRIDELIERDRTTLARITLDACRRGGHLAPDWAIRVDAEARRKAQETGEGKGATKVRNRPKRSEKPSE